MNGRLAGIVVIQIHHLRPGAEADFARGFETAAVPVFDGARRKLLARLRHRTRRKQLSPPAGTSRRKRLHQRRRFRQRRGPCRPRSGPGRFAEVAGIPAGGAARPSSNQLKHCGCRRPRNRCCGGPSYQAADPNSAVIGTATSAGSSQCGLWPQLSMQTKSALRKGCNSACWCASPNSGSLAPATISVLLLHAPAPRSVRSARRICSRMARQRASRHCRGVLRQATRERLRHAGPAGVPPGKERVGRRDRIAQGLHAGQPSDDPSEMRASTYRP